MPLGDLSERGREPPHRRISLRACRRAPVGRGAPWSGHVAAAGGDWDAASFRGRTYMDITSTCQVDHSPQGSVWTGRELRTPIEALRKRSASRLYLLQCIPRGLSGKIDDRFRINLFRDLSIACSARPNLSSKSLSAGRVALLEPVEYSQSIPADHAFVAQD